METYYLVDYENVGSSGLTKCNALEKTDHLHIFYTENQKKIDLDIVDNHGKAEFETHKVPTKSQSVDMHIVSYMGYLLGKYEGKSVAKAAKMNVDGVTGATYSSNALKKNVQLGLEYYKTHK